MKTMNEVEIKELWGTHLTLPSGLTVTNFDRYFDVTGSYMDHYQATANREPTPDEMEELFKYKIVCVTTARGETTPVNDPNYTPPFQLGAFIAWALWVGIPIILFFVFMYYGFLAVLRLPPWTEVSTPIAVWTAMP